MKLCIISLKKFCYSEGTFWTYGGFGDYVASFLPFVDKLDLCVPVTHKPLSGMYPLKDPKISVTPLPFYRNELELLIRWPLILWRMRRSIQSSDLINPRIPDMTGVAGWLWSRWYKKPLFVSVQSDMQEYLSTPGSTRTRGLVRWGLRTWIRLYLAFEKKIFRSALCFPQGRRLKSRYPEAPESYEWLSSSISEQDLVDNPKPRCGNPVIKLLHVGRVTQAKGHSYLIELLAFLKSRCPQKSFSLTCVGKTDGQLYAELREKSTALGVAEQITWVPNVTHAQVFEHFDAADILVFPSRWEGTPKVLLEAMARGLPIVAHDVGGIPSLVESGRNGILVPLGHIPALAEAVEALCADSALRASIAKSALNFASQHTIRRQTEFILKKVSEKYPHLQLAEASGTRLKRPAAPNNESAKFARAASAENGLIKLLLVIFSLLLSIGLAEVFLRVVPFTRDSYLVRFRSDPDYMFHYAPSQDLRTLFGKRITINQYGLRDTSPYSQEKEQTRRRVLVLGDSVGFGLNVDDREIFSSLLLSGHSLERTLGAPVEIVNGSCESYNTWNELRWYEKVGRSFKPDEVWLIYVSNDFAPRPSSFGYISPDGMSTDNPRSKLPLWLRFHMRSSALVILLHEYLSSTSGIDSPSVGPNRDDPEVIRASIDSFRQLTAEVVKNAKLKVFYQVGSDESLGGKISAPSKTIPEVAESLGIPFYPLAPALRAVAESGASPYLAHDPIHLSPAGHQALAQQILAAYQKP